MSTKRLPKGDTKGKVEGSDELTAERIRAILESPDTPEARSGLMASLGGLLDSARRRPASVVSMGRWRNKKGATSETATTTRPHSPPRALEL